MEPRLTSSSDDISPATGNYFLLDDTHVLPNQYSEFRILEQINAYTSRAK